jgi:hypothetical protein
MLYSNSRLGPPSSFLPSSLPIKTHYPPRPIHLMILDLITGMICGEEHQSQSSSLCCVFQSPFGPKIPSSALCSPVPSMQGWQTYGTCVQNGMRIVFLATWHSRLSQFCSLNFSCPTSFSILRTILVRVYTHT